MDFRTSYKIVKPYAAFCFIYDKVANKVKYEREKYKNWHDFIKHLWKTQKFNPKTLLDLACGTGTNSVIFAKENMAVYGVDNSTEMLALAKRKSSNLNIKYFKGSFKDFKTPSKVDSAICLDFSTNYLLSKKDFSFFLNRVYETLNEGGIFIFDFKPCEAFLKKELHVKDKKFNLDIFFDIKNKPYIDVEMNIALLKKKLIKQYKEKHLERGYTINEIREIIAKTSFKIIGFFDNCKFNEPSKNCELIQVALRKNFNNSL